MRRVDVAKEFYHRLANRNERQGDGSHNAIQFRELFLDHLDHSDVWKSASLPDQVVLDFSGVKKIGPSFANEAFGHFMKYCDPDQFLKVVRIENATRVQELIIREELNAGRRGR